MGFPGRFSTGCRLCRRRKIKCDETRPSCTRCAIYGKTCPGYATTFQFRYKRNSAVLALDSAVDNSCEARNHSELVYPIRGTSQSPSITLPLAISVEQRSLCYFIKRFVCPVSKVGFPGHLSFLLELYDHRNQGVLELATLSVAEMVAFNHFGLQTLRQQSYRNYGAAIQHLQQSLELSEAALSDKTIGAVLLLCLFMDVNNIDESGTHSSGLHYLLTKRGRHQLLTTRGFEIFLLSVIRLQVHSSMTNDFTYADLGSLALTPELSQADNPLKRAVSLACNSVTCCRELLALEGSRSPASTLSTPSRREAELSHIQTCSLAIHEFDRWDRYAASYWASNFKDRSKPPKIGETSTHPRHFDSETACITILIRVCRIRLSMVFSSFCCGLKSLEDYAEIEFTDDARVPALASKLKAEIMLAIADIHHCLPYAFGDRDTQGHENVPNVDSPSGMIILSSLRFMADCSLVREDQKPRIRKYLSRISTSTDLEGCNEHPRRY